MLRVVNLVPDPRPGGPHVRVALLANGLREHGVEMIAAGPDGPAREFYASAGVEYVTVQLSRPRRRRFLRSVVSLVARFPADAGSVAGALRRKEASILHCNGVMTVAGLLAARVAGVRTLWHMNDTLIPSPISRAALAVGSVFVDRVVFSSRATGAHAGRAACTPDDVVYPPVDTTRFVKVVGGEDRAGVLRPLGLNPGVPTVVTVGNVNAVKGHRYLIEAVGLLRRRGVIVQAVIVGQAVDRILERELEGLVRYEQVEKEVRFAGAQTRVEDYLAAATAFAFPSTSEAMPIALLEAMAAGLPCVATRVGGVGEVLEDGVNGIMIDPRQPAQLADALHTLLDKPERRHEMGRKAREAVVPRFSVDAIARHHANIYRSMVA